MRWLCHSPPRGMRQPSALHAGLPEASHWVCPQNEITKVNTIYHHQLVQLTPGCSSSHIRTYVVLTLSKDTQIYQPKRELEQCVPRMVNCMLLKVIFVTMSLSYVMFKLFGLVRTKKGEELRLKTEVLHIQHEQKMRGVNNSSSSVTFEHSATFCCFLSSESPNERSFFYATSLM